MMEDSPFEQATRTFALALDRWWAVWRMRPPPPEKQSLWQEMMASSVPWFDLILDWEPACRCGVIMDDGDAERWFGGMCFACTRHAREGPVAAGAPGQ